MPRYSILRKVPGVTQEEVDAAALRSIWCLADYPTLRWVRSYWDQADEHLLCVYESPDEQTIRDHAVSARIPCDEVHEISEFGPETYLEGSEGTLELFEPERATR